MNLKLIFIIASFLFIQHILSAQTNSFDLTGKWADEKEQIEYHFKADSTIIFSQGGMSVSVNSYSIDFSKSPIWIDMTMKSGNRKMVIPCLLEIINEKEIILEQFPPYPQHPTEFSNSDLSIHKLIRTD